jgi:hypothetical protein
LYLPSVSDTDLGPTYDIKREPLQLFRSSGGRALLEPPETGAEGSIALFHETSRDELLANLMGGTRHQ